MSIHEETPLGHAEYLTATSTDNPLLANQTLNIVTAADWSRLVPGERPSVDAGALLRLASIVGLAGRKKYEAILDFAKKYGAMGTVLGFRAVSKEWQTLSEFAEERHVQKIRSRSARVVNRPRIRNVKGEPIGVWHSEIGRLRRACSMLDSLALIELERTSQLEENLSYFLPLMELRDREETKDVTILDLTTAQKNEMLIAELRRTVIKNLAKEMRPALVGETLPLRLEWQPTTLRGALWLQVARLMESRDRTSYTKCAMCSNVLVFTGDRETGTRAGSRYCSQACVQRAYRKRQARARTLYAKGRSIDAIAKELGVQDRSGRPAQRIVSGWVKTNRRGRRQRHGEA